MTKCIDPPATLVYLFNRSGSSLYSILTFHAIRIAEGFITVEPHASHIRAGGGLEHGFDFPSIYWESHNPTDFHIFRVL